MMLVCMLSPCISPAGCVDAAACTADMLAVACRLDSRGAPLPTDADTAELLQPELLEDAADAVLALLAAAAAAASSPDTVGGSGVSGSANGVQSGGPASKGEDFARSILLAEPTLEGSLLGEVLLLELRLAGSEPPPPAAAAAAAASAAASFAKRVRSLLLAACWCGS
jgi:hypothetical protein